MPVLECGETSGAFYLGCVFTDSNFFARSVECASARGDCHEYQTVQDNDRNAGGDRGRSRNSNAEDAGKRQRSG